MNVEPDDERCSAWLDGPPLHLRTAVRPNLFYAAVPAMDLQVAAAEPGEFLPRAADRLRLARERRDGRGRAGLADDPVGSREINNAPSGARSPASADGC